MSGPFPVTCSILSVEALAREVLPRYDLGKGLDLRLFRPGLNDTYVLRTAASKSYILRAYRAGWRSLADVSYELDALAHLDLKGVPVSRSLAARDGSLVRTLRAPEGDRLVALFTWAPGRTPAYVPEGGATASRYGAALARIHRATGDFRSSHARSPLDLDHLIAKPLASILPHLSHRTEDAAYVRRLAEKLRTRLAALPLNALDQGFCHGDPHGGNAHVTEDGTFTFFDFDGCGQGWRAYDLAVFRWGARFSKKEKECWEPFLRGYQEERPLAPRDLDAAGLFIAARMFDFLGMRINIGPDRGFLWSDDATFDSAIGFLKEWEAEFLPE